MDAGIVTAHRLPLVPQFRPAPVTVPPAGFGLMVIVYGGPFTGPVANVALQVLIAFTCTVVLALVPVQLPPQLVNVKPVAGAAVSVTEVDDPYVAWQEEPPVPHVMPPPLTVPPVGAGDTFS